MLACALAGCAGAAPDSAPTGDSDRDSTDTNAPDDTAPTTAYCPAGMVGVPSVDPTFCIDEYEVTVTDGVAAAVAGVLPTENITYDDAVAACLNTPVVDTAGAIVGYKHMATSQEWEDAGDGVVGDGGTAFPYGDTWIDGACATLDEYGAQEYTEEQAAGSFPACVSSFGTYDQIGNLHEWMDPGLSVDSALALSRFAELGVTVTADSEGALYAEGDVSTLILQVIAALPGNVASRDGRLYVAADEVNWTGYGDGYLSGTTDMPDLGWYPIQIVPMEDGSDFWINAHPADEGAPIPDKRGCAYYAGFGNGCDLHNAQYIHTHDFMGTIGFRCACPAIGGG